MSSIFLLLQKVHETVHDFPMKTNYSEPKIFTGGVDINQWSKLSKKEKKEALKKHWYVYYSFRNPKTGKLVRQTNIKGEANRYHDKRSRYHILKTIKHSLEIVLREGYDPYADNSKLKDYLEKRLEIKNNVDKNQESEINAASIEPIIQSSKTIEIIEAFALVLKLKKNAMAANSFVRYKSRINRFNKWLLSNGFNSRTDIGEVKKKDVINYLNEMLENTSARNRNNARTDLSSFFQTLYDNDLITLNFVKEINIIKTTSKRNKSFSPKQEKEIFQYLKQNDPTLLLFIKFMCYGLLRPIEICRLKVNDVDIKDKKLYVKAKNQPVKIKIIPNILLNDIPDLQKLNPLNPLFSRDDYGLEWASKEESRKDYYSKQFKKVKDKFGLTSDYGLYSFRHTYIAKMYKKLVQESSPNKAKSELMLITGHTSMSGLENYLRSIDAELPKDYSNLLT